MQRELLLVLCAALFVSFVFGYATEFSFTSNALPTPATKPQQPSLQPSAQPMLPTVSAKKPVLGSVSLRLPAADKEGNGAFAELTVSARQGSGSVFIEMDSANPLVDTDTQDSVRMALDVAKRASGREGSDLDFFYSIKADSEMVAGKSAGAALTVATMALLRGEKLREDYAITGTIEKDSRIGRVGKILAKAKVAKEFGYSAIIVPRGEAISDGVDVESEVGIKVIEEDNVYDAYKEMKSS